MILNFKCNKTKKAVEIFADGESIALPVHTTPIPVGSKDRPNRQVIKWDEWVILPVQYCELARESVVCIRLLDFATEECLGSSVFELFSEDGEFRHGKRDICVWPRTKPDPGNNLTPGRQGSGSTKKKLLRTS